MSLRNKRLAVFLPALHGGGAERTMLSLAKGISESGHQVDLVLARAIGPYMKDIPEKVRLIDLDSRGTFASFPALVRYLRRERPYGMVSALSRANLVALFARKLTGYPKRLIVNEQNTLSEWAGGSERYRERIVPFLARHSYHWATAIAAVSRGVADDLEHICGIPGKNLKVVFNPGATPDVIYKSQLPLEHPWFGAGQPPVLISVGRLAAQKDFKNLLKAFSLVRSNQLVRLIILGEGPERAMLEAEIEHLAIGNDVELPGFADNPYAYMSRSAAFVMSSIYEGLPTVLVEAMTCGTPIVSTNCPSGPLEILDGGRLGILVPMKDPVRLAEGIKKILNGEGPNVPEECWRPYSIEVIAQQYLTLLMEKRRSSNHVNCI